MYEWMADAIEEAEALFQDISLDWQFKLNRAATEREILTCENELNIQLPLCYRRFILKHNGAHLFCSASGNISNTNSWWADSGIVIFGTKALIEYRPQTYDYFIYDDNSTSEDYSSILPIAYLGRLLTGDFCSLNLNDSIQGHHAVIDCDHELPPSDWKKATIAESLDVWLRKIFECVIKGKSFPEYWIEDHAPNMLLTTS